MRASVVRVTWPVPGVSPRTSDSAPAVVTSPSRSYTYVIAVSALTRVVATSNRLLYVFANVPATAPVQLIDVASGPSRVIDNASPSGAVIEEINVPAP